MSLSNELSPSNRTPALPLLPSIALALTFTVAVFAAAQAPAAPTTPAAFLQAAAPQAATGPAVRGTITDPDDELIPGAAITLAPNSGKPYTTTSGSDGTYTLRGVPAGTYNLTVTMAGFATYVKPGVKILGTSATVLNAKMSIQSEEVVNVTSEQAMVSVDADSNASATVLTGAALDALSDDPDELQSELEALAGPSSGPNGGQIYIDGFTGGQLPPKSSIREIRINQNPFSAQYDRVGFGRIEIFTKPGTDKFHGNIALQGNDRSFNTGSVFIPANTFQPDYHTIFFNGNVTGPINKKASFSGGGSYRVIQDNSIVNPPAVYSTSQNSGVICAPGQAGCNVSATITNNGYTLVQFEPQIRWDSNIKLDLQVTPKNTLSTRVQYFNNTAQNQGIGGLSLPIGGNNTSANEFTIQSVDTQILSPKVINETRFEYQRPTSVSSPFNTSPAIEVQGAFSGGGSNSGSSDDIQNHIEVQNYTSIAEKKNFIRLGGRLRTTSDQNTSTAGNNGDFVYNSIANYAAGAAPTTFSLTVIPTPTVQVRTTDLGLYAEDDWKIKPNWTFSYGIRFETQNYIHDKADFAPRLSTAYGLTKKTVLRAGFGIFYDRFLLSNQLAVARNNGVNQQDVLLTSANIPAACTPTTLSACPTATAGVRTTTDGISSNLRAPYSMQFNVGVDQQINKYGTVSVNYNHVRGVHQFVDEIANYNPTNTTSALQYQYQSEGEFNQNQLIVNVNVRGIKNVTIFGFYTLNFANGDTAGINSFSSVPNNIKADLGRASFDIRSRVFIGGNISLPHLIALAPLIVANSGSPYNITSGTDPYSIGQYNYRAVPVPAGTVPSISCLTSPGATGCQYVKTIAGCGTFATPGTAGVTTEAPINECTGPGSFSTNLRITKTFGFGKLRNADTNRPQRQPGQGGQPPPGMGGGGAPGGGGGGRGGGGGGGGGMANSGRRYNLGFGAQFSNIFNIADRSAPVGTLTSPSFGTSTSLAGGLFTTNSAIRRIQLQTSFTF